MALELETEPETKLDRRFDMAGLKRGGGPGMLLVSLPGGDLVVARTEGRKPPARGVPVTFRVDPADVFAFHPVTGARLAG